MKDYYIGLDVGTDSIGWAVTNQDYSIPKFKGNAMWGIRLLEESQTADERRGFRSARRRTSRNKFRIECLQMLFDEEISKKDVAFFQRLAESNLYLEDKSASDKYSVFADKDFTDKDYHKLYPTVYHLRKELVKSTEPHDVRLVYLAISHIVKNRGHFLFDSETLGNDGLPNFNEIWNDLCSSVNDYFDDVDLYLDNTNDLINILKSKTSKTNKKNALVSLYGRKDEPMISLLTLLSGGTVQLAKMFNDDTLKDSDNKSLSFSSSFDDKASEYESALGTERYELIEKLKAIYDWAILADILNGEQYISFSKCNIYNKHKNDLNLLKAYVKEYCPNRYAQIFKENKKGTNNYIAYSGHTSKGSVEKKCSYEDFIDFLKKQLPKECKDEKYASIYTDIEAYTFMPKAVSKDNSVIPMQVNRAELKKIIDNAKTYLSFLNDIDEKGKSVADKIIDVFSYRIPYYVGPLNNHSDKSWVVRTNEKIYPWNFKEVVDVDKSAEAFIENLTSKCTYLRKEDVLPKSSLLYTKFMVLNELNNLKVDGNNIPVELKQTIYNELFMHKSKVTQKALKNFLKSYYAEDFDISGIDGDFKSNLKSHMDFAQFDLTVDEKEDIIKAITIFGDDKALLKKRITSKYSSKLSNDEIKKICKLKYTGWGRLSKEFLSGIVGALTDSGEADTIINLMWSTNNNLMQLLSKDYSFLDVIKEQNDSEFKSLKKEVEELYVSPKVKRPIYQSMLIVEELVKIQKQAPKKIFIEVARGEEAKKRTVSRKAKLLDLYKSCKKDNLELYNQLANTDESELRRDALYLYYTQFGKCMYSGERIDVSELYNKNIYDIDHIFPQSKIKDDSLDNRVLVLKTINEKKGNIYPISQDIRTSQANFWKMLLSKELISKKKYERLTRNTALSDDELASFINRQLVETRQSTKAIAELLQKRYPDTKIVYVKASLASEFRQKYELIKCREVNDFHHAKDAYLNIVVGNVYDTKFTSRYFISDLQFGKASLKKMYDYDVAGAWNAENDESLKLVKNIMMKNNIRFTRYSYVKRGKLFDATIEKKKDNGGKATVSLKKNFPISDFEKYGGYTGVAISYFAIVEALDKNKKTIRLVPIKLYNEFEYKINPIDYTSREIGKKVVRVVVPCVKINTLFKVDGFLFNISGNGDSGRFMIKPAVQLVLNASLERYAKLIVNYLNKCEQYKSNAEPTEYDKISVEKNNAIYDTIVEKLSTNIYKSYYSDFYIKLAKAKEKFVSLSLYEQCVVIKDILHCLKCDTFRCDIKSIGVSWVYYRRSKIFTENYVEIINQSITGLYEQKIDLLK